MHLCMEWCHSLGIGMTGAPIADGVGGGRGGGGGPVRLRASPPQPSLPPPDMRRLVWSCQATLCMWAVRWSGGANWGIGGHQCAFAPPRRSDQPITNQPLHSCMLACRSSRPHFFRPVASWECPSGSASGVFPTSLAAALMYMLGSCLGSHPGVSVRCLQSPPAVPPHLCFDLAAPLGEGLNGRPEKSE